VQHELLNATKADALLCIWSLCNMELLKSTLF